MTFQEAGLGPEILQAVNELGFEQATPIQEKTIPHLLGTDKDLIALAQTGTGKTAAFGLPIVEQIEPSQKNVQALVLCPTRELCLQITGDLKDFSKYVPGFAITAVYGGANIETQIRQLKRGVHIVVATPGRALDLIKRKQLRLGNVNWVVLDEADEMLTMGFKEELDGILEQVPAERQTLLFSATMSAEVLRISKNYMKEPEEISVGQRNIGAENVSHFYVVTRPHDKYEALKRIADVNPDIYGIIFCRTRNDTKEIAEKLIADGYNADALHGDLSQAQRDQVMNRFRSRHLQVLVATDVAARGLDVDDITTIVNYGLPDENPLYVHRSGRTGRAGKFGMAISIIIQRDLFKIRILEKMVGKKFEIMPVPSGKQICEKQLFNLVSKVENVDVDEKQIEPFMSVIFKKLSWMERDELIKRFVSVEFNRFLAYYKNSRDLNLKPGDMKDDRKGKGKDKRPKYSRFYINRGSKQNVDATGIIGIINEYMPDKKVKIGKIEIYKKFSFVELDSNHEQEVIDKFSSGPILLEKVKNKPMDERDDDKGRRGKKQQKDSSPRFAGKRQKKKVTGRRKRR